MKKLLVIQNDRMIRIGVWMFAMLCVATAFAQVSIVDDGEIRAVVVTAVKPSQVAAYAVEELVNHIEKATGKRLPVAVETEIPKGYTSRIFVGVTEAALKQGIEPDKLELEEFVLRTIGSDLYILGKELHPDREILGSRPERDPNNPLSLCNEHSGTLFGVYEVLDRYVGVRWLWPGELGTYVPRSNTIKIPKINKTIKPRMIVRWLGTWWMREMGVTGSWCGVRKPPVYSKKLTEELVRNLMFPTEEAGYTYGKAMEVYIRRHRMVLPVSRPIRVAQASHILAGIRDWWAEHGKEHPEWFAMRADGGRGMKSPRPGNYTAMCISNPELQRFIVEKAWNGSDYLNLGEADVGGEGFCHCPNCLAWDGPQPKEFPEIMRGKYTPRVMSDRYARFWKTIYEMAVKRNPDVKIAVFLYHNTLPAPLTDIKFNENVHGTFVIYGSWDGWYPMSEEEDRWYREQWIGWANTGMKIINRSNYLLTNYVTPNITTWQAGKFLKFGYEHGMIGVVLESYNFSWAAQGLMAYMYHRLLDNPEMEIKDIHKEYFSAFGPAAGYVEEYFDYWEKYVRTRPPISSVGTGDKYGALEKLRRARGHYLAYPPEVYPPAEALLKKALDAARKDPLPEFTKRVKFLQAGLKHALLSTGIHEFLDYDSAAAESGSAPIGNPEKLRQARQAMRELIKFRHDPENFFVSDYMSNARVEQNFIRNIEALFLPDGKDFIRKLEDILRKETAFQSRWPGKAVRSPEEANLRIVESRPVSRLGWRFRKDPERRGDLKGWHLPETVDDDWQKVEIEKVWETFLSDAYVGAGWYRRNVEVSGQPSAVYLHFGAVDESCWVWVNGIYVGRHDIGPKGWTVPFRLEITNALKPGENLVVARVMNTAGAGGIWRPVSLEIYEPVPGN